LGFGVSTLEPISLLLLAASFFVGIKHLEEVLVLRRINYEWLKLVETVGNLTEALNSGPGPYCNVAGPGVFQREQTQALRQQCLDKKELLEGDREAVTKRAASLARIRNRLLFLGFLAIFLSKILQPYVNAL
jgi:hypothetical protein